MRELKDLTGSKLLSALRTLSVYDFNQYRKRNPDWHPDFRMPPHELPLVFRSPRLGELFHTWTLDSINLSNANLEGVQFWYVSMKDADLSHANLHLTSFHGVDLTGANLTGANLERADMGNTNMEGANLSQTDTRQTHLTGANLKDADFTDAKRYKFKVTEDNPYLFQEINNADELIAFLQSLPAHIRQRPLKIGIPDYSNNALVEFSDIAFASQLTMFDIKQTNGGEAETRIFLHTEDSLSDFNPKTSEYILNKGENQ